MRTDLYIARRYLVAKKSLGVIHVISVISAIGIAIGTAALILILSVYNGFDRIIEDNLSDLSPDLLVTPVRGSFFVPEGPAFEALLDDPRILQISSVVQAQVFLNYDGKQALAQAKGVDDVYAEDGRLDAHTVEGSFSLYDGDLPQATLGATLARKLGIRTHFLQPLAVYFPRRGARLPLTGPGAMMNSIKLQPGCLISINATLDEELLLLPLAQMRTLLGLKDGEVSALELTLDGRPDARLRRSLQEQLGPDFRLLDRYQQQPSIYKMMRYEKLAVFLILLFVVIIIASNIFGSLSMLSIAKREDMQTLRALGANDTLVRRIFIWEGCLVSLCGMVAGLLVGVVLALVQQHFGVIKMPGGFFLQAYPVVLQVSDLLWTAIGVGLIGSVIALLSAPAANRQ